MVSLLGHVICARAARAQRPVVTDIYGDKYMSKLVPCAGRKGKSEAERRNESNRSAACAALRFVHMHAIAYRCAAAEPL
jgi:hypothetical protein